MVILASLGFTVVEKESEAFMAEDALSESSDSEFNFFESQEESFDSGDNGTEFRFFADSTDSNNFTILTDSTIADSARFDSLSRDSTARLKYFRHSRDDNHVVSVGEKKRSSFFAYPSPSYYRRTVQLDSTGQYVLIKELVNNNEEKIYLKLPIEEFISLRLDALNRGMWEKQAYAYEINESEGDLGKFLSDITNIEIPLPSTGVLSIFGDPKISLRINGSVDIHGAWRTETTEGLTASRLGNTRNEPDFSQQVQISVVGKIGDKLSINADWNTERTFEYENQLKLVYTGYEDEIIQKVEAGNVSLQTSPLVGGGEALFGVKSTFKMGPFTLTALASQKKGEVKEVNVSGGSEKQTFEIHAYEYSINNYFVHTAYPDNELFNKYYGNPIFTQDDSSRYWEIKELEVWKSTTGLVDQGRERKVNAFINLPSIGVNEAYDSNSVWYDLEQDPVNGESVINSRFIKLTEGVDYIYQPYVGYISFKTQIQKDDNIAVAFRIQGESPDPNQDLVFGQFTKDQTDSSVILLRLIKPQNLQPQYKTAWKLQLKNIYPIGGRDIKKEGFTLDITYRTEGEEPQNTYDNGTPYLQLFGLDKTDESGASSNPDGAFDFNDRTIFTQTGEIIFPTLQPFGEDFPTAIDTSRRYQAVYDTTKTFAEQDRAKDKFLIVGEYSASVTSTYNIGFSVVENSVRVTLGGNQMQEGVDYVVDYNIGQLTIRNDAALVPGADLKITYEQNDLFQLASKTLLGMRGMYEFSKDTKLGFSFLNLDQQTLSDKVRIGEEPLSNSIYGIDFETKVDLPFLTNTLDYFISTRANSSLNVKGEFAYMSPDPNTKKSTIASDNSGSIAYIDDFEGAKKIIPIGLGYTAWKDISIPAKINPTLDAIDGLQNKLTYKAKAWWFQVIPSGVTATQIWPDRQVAREDEQVTILDIIYNPSEFGMNNNFPETDSQLKDRFGGMMKGLSSTASNLIEENIEFIEFWVQMKDLNNNITHFPDAKLRIDLGQISEDIIPNGILNTEDKNSNDIVDEGEDTGIDGLNNPDEPGYSDTNPDPSGDDFALIQPAQYIEDYKGINGTEGNAQLSDIGRFPDSEDLNRNFSLDRVNSYYIYEIPLDTNRLENEFVTGGGLTEQKWYQFKVPLKDFQDFVGNPSFSNVENIRVWFTGLDKPVRLRFADFNLVGNQWQKVLVPGKVDESDEVLTISTINIEENGDVYSSPPGVGRERDRTRPDQEVFKNEQSLQLLIKNLEDGDRREVVKYLFKPLDVFNYKEMKFFVHGDQNYGDPGSVSYFDRESYSTEIYFRFGSDSTNFYEYRQPVRYNISNNGWDEISIVFDDLTAIKEKRNPDSTNVYYKIPIEGKEGHFRGIRGNPTLTRITFFTIGILNKKDFGSEARPVSGDIWVNELRVLGADDTPGWAYSVSGSFKLADLLSVNFNAKQTDPYFHKLNERFGNRIDQKSWGISASLDVIKLLPVNLEGSSLNIQYSHNESISNPLYKPGTDVLVSKAAESSENPDSLLKVSETFNIKDSWNISNIKLRIPTDYWLIRDTFNSLTFGFNYNTSYSRSPTVEEKNSWIWNAKGNYALNLGKDHFIYPANLPVIGVALQLFSDYRNLKIYYLPQSFNAGVSAKRNRNYSLARKENADEQIQRDFTATRNFDFKWTLSEGGLLNPSLNYNLSILSSLAHVLVDSTTGTETPESEIWNQIFGGEGFGKDYDYNQTFDFKLGPALPSLLDLNRYFKINAGYSVTYNWKWNFQQNELGRSAGYSNRINAGLNLRLKSMMDPIFGDDKPTTGVKPRTPTRGRGNPRSRGNRGRNVDQEIEDQNNKNEERNSDSTSVDSDSLEVEGPGLFFTMFDVIKGTTKYILFDYEQISFNFSQANTYSAGGLTSEGTGFWNFWGLEYKVENGPSRLFMLGLSNNAGPRAVGGSFQDRASTNNKFDFKTSRPLWEGAKLDISWNTGWGKNESKSFSINEVTGQPEVTNVTSSGNIDRSFLHLPFPPFNSGLKKVHEIYLTKTSENVNQNLSEAFVEGLESFPWLSQLPGMEEYGKYIPRPNWKISWSGLEKLSFLEGLAQRISLNHAYTSSYSEGWKLTADGTTETQVQKVSYGFSPLIGVNLTFKELLGGNVTGSIKFSSKTNFDLGLSTQNITESLQKDINITASYSKSGFEIPLFGLSLKNDIEISFSYTLGQNSVVLYRLGDEVFNESGEPQDGTTRTTIEPRIRYVMSSRVTLSIFFKMTSVEPQGASRIPPTTTNEAGLDVHISIQ